MKIYCYYKLEIFLNKDMTWHFSAVITIYIYVDYFQNSHHIQMKENILLKFLKDWRFYMYDEFQIKWYSNLSLPFGATRSE